MFFAGLICTPAVPRRDVDICFCTDAASRKSTGGMVARGAMAPRPELARRAARLKAPPIKKTKKREKMTRRLNDCVLMLLYVCPYA